LNHPALRILIADDDEGDRKLIKRALSQSGLLCNCSETDTSEHALELCQQSEFDCVLVDYRLPGEDGLAGITALHERFPHLPIVMSTGQGDELVAADAIKRGASDYVPKAGIHAASIRRIVENAIEKAALRRKVLEQADDLENFARLLAHDLKAPVLTILGFSQLVQEELKDGNPDEAIACSNRVIHAAQRMARLIETLREYTRADTQVVLDAVDMDTVLAGTLANLHSLLAESGAAVTADPLPAVEGNAPQLSQLLQNLIANGIKYCEQPVARIHVGAAQTAGGGCTFSVRDNGIGIPEAHYKKVFEPLKRMNGAAKVEGTGLGLATCKRIVERHGGRIWCEPAPGAGTVFYFTLNAAVAAEKSVAVSQLTN
jgi:signal transduction histidine kinase